MQGQMITLVWIFPTMQSATQLLSFKFQVSKLSLNEFYIDNNLLTFVDSKVIEGLENARVVDMRSNLCVDSKVPDDWSILKLGIHVGGCSIE